MGNYLSILGRIEFQAHVRTLVLDEAEVEEDHELEAFKENADLQKTLTIQCGKKLPFRFPQNIYINSVLNKTANTANMYI